MPTLHSKKRDKEKVSHLICEAAVDLLADGGEDADLKALYNRHRGSDFDEEDQALEAATGELMKSMMGGMLGIDFGDADVSSMEKMKAFVEEKMESMRTENESRQREAEARRAKRKKTAKQQAKEDQIDQTQINNIAEDRLKHYNKILKQQLEQLQQEIQGIESVTDGQKLGDCGKKPMSPSHPARTLA